MNAPDLEACQRAFEDAALNHHLASAPEQADDADNMDAARYKFAMREAINKSRAAAGLLPWPVTRENRARAEREDTL